MTLRVEATSPISVRPRPAGRGREIISVEPGEAAREGVEIHLGAARRETSRETLEARRDTRSVERMLERLRVSGKSLTVEIVQ